MKKLLILFALIIMLSSCHRNSYLVKQKKPDKGPKYETFWNKNVYNTRASQAGPYRTYWSKKEFRGWDHKEKKWIIF